MSRGSEIYLLSGVPLTSEYKHTIYFSSSSAQLSYFTSHYTTVFHATGCSYLRPERGTVKIEGSITAGMYNANYCIIRNTSHENKYFYCFVNNVKYISDNCFEIDYQIDYLQTYITNVVFNSCYIVRHHATSDGIGQNLQPEPITPIQFVADSCETVNNDVMYRIRATRNPITETYTGTYWSNGEVDSLTVVDKDSPAEMRDTLLSIMNAGHAHYIVSMQYVPKITTTRKTITRPSTINGYTPKNKKCLSSLYQHIVISTSDGNSKQYFFDYSSVGASSMSFDFVKTQTGELAVICYPTNYNGVINNCDEGIVKSNYPMMGVPSADYNEYFNTHKWQLWSQPLVEGISGVGNALTLNIGGAMKDVGNLVGQAMVQQDMKSRDGLKGGSGTTLPLAIGRIGFTFMVMQCRRNEIRLIDEYFEKYGYTQNNVATPNPTARPCWTYIETRDCCVGGAIPNTAKSTFNNALNNGITFWRSSATALDYTQNNSI